MKNESQKLANRAAAIDAQAKEVTAPPPEPEVEQGQDAQQAPPLEVGAEAASVEQQAAPAISPEQEARSLVDMAVELALPWYPALAQVYTEDARARLAVAAAPLMAKYNVSVGSIFDQWREEIGFALVALPIALQTVKVITAERARKAMSSQAQASESPKAEQPPEKTPFGYNTQAEEDAAYIKHHQAPVV